MYSLGSYRRTSRDNQLKPCESTTTTVVLWGLIQIYRSNLEWSPKIFTAMISVLRTILTICTKKSFNILLLWVCYTSELPTADRYMVPRDWRMNTHTQIQYIFENMQLYQLITEDGYNWMPKTDTVSQSNWVVYISPIEVVTEMCLGSLRILSRSYFCHLKLTYSSGNPLHFQKP